MEALVKPEKNELIVFESYMNDWRPDLMNLVWNVD